MWILPKKQRATHAQFANAWRNIESLVSKRELDDLIDRTVHDIQLVTRGKNVAYAWSGGKDSQALRFVCERAGVYECLMGMSDLEWPAFLQWVTDNMPPGLEVINTHLDLAWLAKNPDMLFPSNSQLAARYFRLIQHAAQKRYNDRHKLDMLLLGRRAQDGNYMGKDGSGIYTSKGVTRYSPCQHWRHVDVLAVCHYYKVELPPCYDWPRGFRVGTGCWSARQWTRSVDHGWSECWSIDPSVVVQASKVIPSAAQFMRSRGLS